MHMMAQVKNFKEKTNIKKPPTSVVACFMHKCSVYDIALSVSEHAIEMQ